MAKRPTDFAQQNNERSIEVANYSLNWMREIAERNLSQSRAALEDLLTITRKAVDGIDHRASVIREHSILLREGTLEQLRLCAKAGSYAGTAGTGSVAKRIRQPAGAGARGSNQGTRAEHRPGGERGGEDHAAGDGRIIAKAVRGRVRGPAT